MALAVASSSTSISGRTFSPSTPSFDLKAVTFSQRRSSVKPVNAQSKRNESIVPLAATIVAPEAVEKVEAEDFTQLAKGLENASPLEIMDKALEKFGNDIAIAFRIPYLVAVVECGNCMKDMGISLNIKSVDPVFEGLDGGIGSLVKWNPVANVEGRDIWDFLRAMNVPVNSLHSKGYISIGCEPCTRSVLPGQHEREGRWWWEDAKAKECGLHKGNIKQEEGNQSNGNGAAHSNGTATETDIFTSQNLVTLSRTGIENLARLENRHEPWIVVLYAPWCQFCQAMEGSYIELADKLAGSGVKVGKFRADGEQKEFAQNELQLGSFPTILFFPKHSSRPIKYPSEKRDVDSLMAFINALR
ncbi:Hypothetical predicted protein [Prunus dulcis]|uniref:Thioredoxin domain-containing protein n=1 Tax=Prunus dulcis TaxID=3755 RepID=A0A5E4F0J6_PRUDU|nr:Hypothetical predicted protein [Prunus dulcis]